MDQDETRIEPGALVTASDGPLGTVRQVVVQPETGDLAYLVVGRGLLDEPVLVPAEAIETVDGPHAVHLWLTRAEAAEQGAQWSGESDLGTRQGQTLRIPILEERLRVGKRQVDLGELRIHTSVDHEEQTISQPVTRDDLVVERVAIGRVLSEPVESRMEGNWLVIPIMREELVVQKRLVLVEEVRIGKRQVTEEQTLRETVRHTRIELEDATVHGIHEVGERSRQDGGPG